MLWGETEWKTSLKQGRSMDKKSGGRQRANLLDGVKECGCKKKKTELYIA